ncbi:hypothetical protein V6R85_01450 [Agrobacterium sp. CCNWLW32]|uniref:hypothetical protein n=1 Tax=Agrobacterium sp. CCNWLW32 TaxID=3122072 RepID=UPI003010274B
MDILQKLFSLGFKNATVLDEKKGLTRVRTAKGWVYERFQSEEHIEAWSDTHKPEIAE